MATKQSYTGLTGGIMTKTSELHNLIKKKTPRPPGVLSTINREDYVICLESRVRKTI